MGDVELLTEKLLHLFSKGACHLQADHCHPSSLVQGFLHHETEVIIVRIGIIVRRDVGVPCDADIIFIGHLVLTEDQLHVFQDHLFDANITHIMSRKVHDLGHELGNRNDPHHSPVIQLEIRHNVDFLIKQVGERMVHIHDLRGKHRQDLFLKIFFNKLLFLGLQLLEAHAANPIGGKLFLDLRIGLIPLLVKGRHRAVDRLKLLPRRHPGFQIHLFVVHGRHV